MDTQTASAVPQHPAPAPAGVVPPVCLGHDLAAGADSSVIVSLTVTHNRIAIAGALCMGAPAVELQAWERRAGSRLGWVQVSGPRDFVDAEDRIGLELAEYLDGLEFPFKLANMLPGKRASQQAVAEAAKAVQS